MVLRRWIPGHECLEVASRRPRDVPMAMGDRSDELEQLIGAQAFVGELMSEKSADACGQIGLPEHAFVNGPREQRSARGPIPGSSADSAPDVFLRRAAFRVTHVATVSRPRFRWRSGGSCLVGRAHADWLAGSAAAESARSGVQSPCVRSEATVEVEVERRRRAPWRMPRKRHIAGSRASASAGSAECTRRASSGRGSKPRSDRARS
jgi:hypothetical protein